MTTTHHAGSATGFDLAALMDSNPLAAAFKLALGTIGLKDHDEAVRIAEMARAALARATPQHPADLSNAELLSKRLARVARLAGVTMPTGMTHEDIAAVAGTILGDIARHLEKAATPQHSVTEQDERQIAMTVDDAMRIVKANWGDMGAIENAFAANRAQPLASTAATQPEQADELSIADRIREVQANMEGEASLQVLCALDDELNEARAALAIPASASTKLLVDAAMGVVNKWVMLAGYDEEETQRFCDQLQAAFGSIPASTAASEQLPVCAPNCFYGDCPPCVAAGLRPAAASEQQAGADERALVRDAVSQALTGVYYCGRVWSAWNVGTMDESDFTPAAEVDEVLDEITDRAMAAITHRDTPATATASASVNCPWEKPFD